MRFFNALSLVVIALLGSCFDPPQYSTVPRIEFNSVRVKDVADPNVADSLIVVIDFRDGDGDIGTSGSENDPPFNERWYFLKNPIPTCEPGVKAPCKIVSFVDDTNLDKYVSYSLKRTDSPAYDTLPDFVQPYDCTNYFVVRGVSNNPIDTLYCVLNDRYNNFFADVYYKVGADFKPFEGFNFPFPNCELYGLDGRLPILAKDGDLSNELPLEGSITYKVASTSLDPLIGKTLKLKIRIMDRAGHLSNEIETKEFAFK